MNYSNQKQLLYETAHFIRTNVLELDDKTPCNIVKICRENRLSDVAFLPFKTSGLRGMAVLSEMEGQDIILLNEKLTYYERNFYCAHELMHLLIHRKAGGATFQCYQTIHPNQNSFLEWQANEGGAELVIPYRDFFIVVKQNLDKLHTSVDYKKFKLQLMERYGVSKTVVDIKFESLKYELYQYLSGIPIDHIQFLSFSAQQRHNISVPSFNDIEKKLFYKELQEIVKRKKDPPRLFRAAERKSIVLDKK